MQIRYIPSDEDKETKKNDCPLAKHLGFEVDYSILKENASYVRNSLVMASNGIYSKFEYLERIFKKPY